MRVEAVDGTSNLKNDSNISAIHSPEPTVVWEKWPKATCPVSVELTLERDEAILLNNKYIKTRS